MDGLETTPKLKSYANPRNLVAGILKRKHCPNCEFGIDEIFQVIRVDERDFDTDVEKYVFRCPDCGKEIKQCGV